MIARLPVFAFLSLFAAGAARAEEVLTVATPRGAEQSFAVIAPNAPEAIVILFPGGDGAINLARGRINPRNGNFLVRSRRLFADHGFLTAVMDAPSDRDGMSAEYRMSEDHGQDIAAVIDRLTRIANAPVWLVGTSRGVFSAANGAIRLDGRVAGLALTSPVTKAAKRWNIARSHPNGVADMALGDIGVPVMVVAHENDACRVSPPSGARALAAAQGAELLMVDGGDPPRADTCKGLSAHGFLGLEARAVDAIAAFIAAH